jgi:hypothetical protein
MRPFHNVTAKGMTVTYGETVSREKPSQSDWLRNCGNATWKHELCIDLLLWQEQITCKLLCLSLSNVTLHKLVALAPDFRITGKRLGCVHESFEQPSLLPTRLRSRTARNFK